MASKISINLDTSKENYISTKCKQNDDLKLEAFIYENGSILDLTNKEISIQALKADNTYIIQNTNIVKEKNKILAELDRDFSRVPGTTKIEIVLTESSKKNTTFSFCLEVIGSVIKGAVQSSDAITALEEVQAAVTEIGRINEETQTLVNNAGAASKEDFNKVNASLEHNTFEIESINNKIKAREVYVEDFGAKGDYDESTDTGTDDTQAIQNAINYAYENKINVVSFGSAGYVVTSPITVKYGITLKGTKELVNQGKATDTTQGGSRYRKVENTALIIKPTVITDKIFTFERNSGIMNLSIIYYQNYASTSIIKYGDCITATHGFNINNVLVSGCYNFIKATGEAIQISNIYGYPLGTGIDIRNSADVCHISNIHFNPNVTRPVVGFTSTRKSDANSIAIRLEDCDGVNITDFFCIAYKTGIKAIGNSVVGQNTFNISNFYMDWVGLAFDLDQDCGWAININNGITIIGFDDDASHAGFIRFDKTNGNVIFQPINITNVSFNVLSEYIGITGIKPNFSFNFIFKYSWMLNIYNFTHDSTVQFANDNNAYWTGFVRSGNSYKDLAFETTPRNIVINPRLDEIVDGLPKGWSKSNSAHTITSTKNRYGNTEIKFSITESKDWLGIRNTVTISEKATMRLQAKFRMSNTSANARLFVTYEDGTESIFLPNSDGYINPIISNHSTFYITISPGTGGDKVEVEYITLQSGDGNRPIKF